MFDSASSAPRPAVASAALALLALLALLAPLAETATIAGAARTIASTLQLVCLAAGLPAG